MADSDRDPPQQPQGGAFTGGGDPDSGAKTSSTAAGETVPQTNLSDAGTGHPGYQPPAPKDPRLAGRDEVRRGLIQQAILDTFGQTGARIGGLWVLFLMALAAFAPFLANSRPFYLKRADGTVEFPLFAALNWVDIVLPIAFVGLIGLVLARRFASFRIGHAMIAFVAVLIVLVPVGWAITDPPELTQFEQWRVAEASGDITTAVRPIVPFSPNDALSDLRVLGQRPQQPPSGQNWLGTTAFGEDMLSRMIHATRVALAIGFIATGISTLIGIVVGAVMGFFAGWVDLLMMRGIEIVEAIPRLVLLLIVTSFFGKNIWLMMVTIGVISWTSDARFLRAEFLKLRKLDFVQACVATGLPLKSVLFRHMLPNGVAPLLVNASFGIAGAILLESILSFLGLGLEQDASSWGALLNQAREGGSGFNWWIATFPGLAIFLTVFAYILIGEALRDAIDPKTKER